MLLYRFAVALVLLPLLGGCTVTFYDPNAGDSEEDSAVVEDNAVLEEGYSYEAMCNCMVRPMLIGGEVIFVDPAGRHRHRGLWDRHPLRFQAQQRMQHFAAQRQFRQSQQGQHPNFRAPGLVPQQRGYPVGGGLHPQPQYYRAAPVSRAPPPQQHCPPRGCR